MRISTSNARRKTYNAFGIIHGEVEPGQYKYLKTLIFPIICLHFKQQLGTFVFIS